MNEQIRTALMMGSFVEAYPGSILPWVDARGYRYSADLIDQAIEDGHAEVVRTVRLTTKGYHYAPETETEQEDRG